MTDDRERWALILGGFVRDGRGDRASRSRRPATTSAGIHLDFRAALAHVEEVKAAIEAAGSEALYINMNAADDEKRAAALDDAPRAVRPLARRPAASRTSGSSCTRSPSARSCRSCPRTPRAASTARRWR